MHHHCVLQILPLLLWTHWPGCLHRFCSISIIKFTAIQDSITEDMWEHGTFGRHTLWNSSNIDFSLSFCVRFFFFFFSHPLHVSEVLPAFLHQGVGKVLLRTLPFLHSWKLELWSRALCSQRKDQKGQATDSTKKTPNKKNTFCVTMLLKTKHLFSFFLLVTPCLASFNTRNYLKSGNVEH